MNETIHTAIWEELIPDSLTQDKRITAMAKAIAEQKRKIAAEIWRNRFWIDFDLLPDDLLDVMAYDLKVDWWNDNFTPEQKRNLLKQAKQMHMHLGTPAAVDWAINAVFGNGHMTEWFEYGGTPHHFKVFVQNDGTFTTMTALEDFLRLVWMVKRLSSWLEEIQIETDMGEREYRFGGAMAGITVMGIPEIHFQFGKTSGGTDIAFVDSGYGNNKTSGSWFNMNNSQSNSGGWNGSRMRTTICPAFLSAMPSDWQSAIASCTKYSDNTGGGSDTASYVTSTSDKIWLLSEYEVQGARSYANSAEKNYQVQYAYYANGNSKIKNKHNATTTACRWWLRSVGSGDAGYFCRVTAGGSAGDGYAYYSLGFAPGFKVA